jgi:hypothetical protein
MEGGLKGKTAFGFFLFVFLCLCLSDFPNARKRKNETCEK